VATVLSRRRVPSEDSGGASRGCAQKTAEVSASTCQSAAGVGMGVHVHVRACVCVCREYRRDVGVCARVYAWMRERD
jgi:hypothetical protein